MAIPAFRGALAARVGFEKVAIATGRLPKNWAAISLAAFSLTGPAIAAIAMTAVVIIISSRFICCELKFVFRIHASVSVTS